MVNEVKDEAKVEEPPAVCEFKVYLRDDGKIVIKTDSDECHKAIIEAGKEMGVEVEVEMPAVPCDPCKEAAKRFLAKMQAKRAAAAAPAAPVTES